MPLIQSEVVSGHGWLTMNEFTDLITIAEMTPGPIAVNSATLWIDSGVLKIAFLMTPLSIETLNQVSFLKSTLW